MDLSPLIAPQAAYCSCSGTFCATDRAGVQPVGRRLSPHPQTLTCDETAVVCCLTVSAPVPCSPCNYMDYYSYSNLGGMEG